MIPCDQIVASSVDSSHVWLETRRGSRIEAFFVDRRAQMTVLFSHANAEDVSMVFAWLRELSLRLGVNVLGYSYTGYARSSKPPSELDVYADVDAAWDYLMARKVDARRVVLYSRSVGSGPTLYLAERLSAAGTPPAGVVLQSPILSVFRIAFDFRYTLPGDLFPNVDRVGGARCPVLVIHGTHDEVVPFWHGQGCSWRRGRSGASSPSGSRARGTTTSSCSCATVARVQARRVRRLRSARRRAFCVTAPGRLLRPGVCEWRDGLTLSAPSRRYAARAGPRAASCG